MSLIMTSDRQQPGMMQALPTMGTMVSTLEESTFVRVAPPQLMHVFSELLQ